MMPSHYSFDMTQQKSKLNELDELIDLLLFIVGIHIQVQYPHKAYFNIVLILPFIISLP